ncbi:hypothetical protein [Tunturibacter empetritectus]|uniref:Uncharacterized protein n=1 Tax=Tunturiibacter empetritectus TaxID=3069691 RepID=A0A7W8IMX6_9BACT|nr:hypothetical protein [Edaphobacter lichenicola]MBB5319118.1 hypothetical protein [Edaphobacter lichenicola]
MKRWPAPVEMTIFVGKSGNGWIVWVGRFERYGWVECFGILHSVQDDGEELNNGNGNGDGDGDGKYGDSLLRSE